jgi:Uma2 family endonuclease
MSAALKPPAHMSAEEFLVWNPPDGRMWQLVDGAPQAMAPASEVHARILGEIGGLIRNHLLARNSPCVVLGAPGVRPQVRSRSNVRIPDLAVTCSPPRAGVALTVAPIIAVEILSPSNEQETWANVWAYTTIPSVLEILVVRQDVIGVELLRRRADGSWPDDPDSIARGKLMLASIDFTCDVAAFYRTTHLARPD